MHLGIVETQDFSALTFILSLAFFCATAEVYRNQVNFDQSPSDFRRTNPMVWMNTSQRLLGNKTQPATIHEQAVFLITGTPATDPRDFAGESLGFWDSVTPKLHF